MPDSWWKNRFTICSCTARSLCNNLIILFLWPDITKVRHSPQDNRNYRRSEQLWQDRVSCVNTANHLHYGGNYPQINANDSSGRFQVWSIQNLANSTISPFQHDSVICHDQMPPRHLYSHTLSFAQSDQTVRIVSHYKDKRSTEVTLFKDNYSYM